MNIAKVLVPFISVVVIAAANAEPLDLPGLSKAQLNELRPWQDNPSKFKIGQLTDLVATGAPIGRGYNGLTGEFRGDCVQGNVKTSGLEAKVVNSRY
ncbi:hypothetical protein C2U70_23820 [Bradyrhizobium guangdongense]|uniref:hypothetical protein n=1 Tax=Bradyrhizobium guangdongense TaxID=1325090 RepID=UPI00112D5EBF|nr:hypothetical protein [Bradyrhizobium guangdongense]TPQ31530.1 hypothetical protein C2U70_23820 [Bradyrhizobium guangdongense]